MNNYTLILTSVTGDQSRLLGHSMSSKSQETGGVLASQFRHSLALDRRPGLGCCRTIQLSQSRNFQWLSQLQSAHEDTEEASGNFLKDDESPRCLLLKKLLQLMWGQQRPAKDGDRGAILDSLGVSRL